MGGGGGVVVGDRICFVSCVCVFSPSKAPPVSLTACRFRSEKTSVCNFYCNRKKEKWNCRTRIKWFHIIFFPPIVSCFCVREKRFGKFKKAMRAADWEGAWPQCGICEEERICRHRGCISHCCRQCQWTPLCLISTWLLCFRLFFCFFSNDRYLFPLFKVSPAEGISTSLQ